MKNIASPKNRLPEPPRTPARGRHFYGRRKGHQLHDRQARLMETLLPQLRLPTDRVHGDLTSLFTPRVADVWLEIGFGGGEHLLWQAAQNPEIGHIGCEPYINGVAKMVSAIETQNISNISLYDDDIHDIFDLLPTASIGRVFILFPDPWPKKRHNKRRIISPVVLSHLARLMKPGGELRFASDIPDYVDWALRRILHCGAFSWLAAESEDWRSRPPDWPPTRYETKALAAGRRAAYLRFVRR
ncbi:MAG: tRNA (guanosine(46)-N7)-methyltransferase TrmB [Fimbriimonadaceae bacterium]|nr:tRNA (guanosine(46)-N7)-methyltransferase TrmB [Alphaproteobacteria bacterium]